MIQAERGSARAPSMRPSSDLDYMRWQYIGPFHGQDLPAVEVAAEAVKVDCEIVTDPAGAADLMRQQAERVREVAGDVGEAYAATAELFLKNGGAIVRLMQTDRGGTLEAFWRELQKRRHQDIANNEPTDAERVAITAGDVRPQWGGGGARSCPEN